MAPKLGITTPPQDLQKLFEAAMPELQAFDRSLLVRRFVSRTRALELSETMRNSWAPLVGLLDQRLAPSDANQRKAELARLDVRAWVYYAADLAAEELHANQARKQRRALAKAVAEHDRFLFKWAMPLFGDDPEQADILRDISRGTGARDDAEDVLRLVAMYRAHWDRLAGNQTLISEARLDQAAADATRQLDYLRNGTANPARELADVAYSLWYYDYEELMQLGRYLTRREPDSLVRFPGIRELSVRRGGVEAGEGDEQVEEIEEPSDGPEQDLDGDAVA